MEEGVPYHGFVRGGGPEEQRYRELFCSRECRRQGMHGGACAEFGCRVHTSGEGSRTLSANTVAGVMLQLAIDAERARRGDGVRVLRAVKCVEVRDVRGVEGGCVQAAVLVRDRRRTLAVWAKLLPLLDELPDGTQVRVLRADPHPYDVLLRVCSGDRALEVFLPKTFGIN